MSSPSPFVLGQPGLKAAFDAIPKYVFTSPVHQFLPGGKWIDGAKSRDVSNSPYTDRLLAGLVMGKVTNSGYYANSFFGQNTVAYDGSTTFTVGVADAVELVRRVGSTGSFIAIGPPTAAGTVSSTTLTYSAVNQSTGAVTVTAAAVNEVQTITFGAAATGGTMVLRVTKPDGTTADTGAITWNATDATWLAAINTALDAALAAGAVVATGAAPDTTLTFTFSGTGYAGRAIPALIQVLTLPTSAGSYLAVRTTTGVDARKVAGSVIAQADGSQTPLTFLPGQWPVPVTDGFGSVATISFPDFPVDGQIDETRLTGYSAMDASLKTWLLQQLSTALGGKYVFKGTF